MQHDANNSYVPQTGQYEPERQMLFCLRNVTNLFDVTTSNQMPHPLSPPPKFHFVLFKVKDLVAKRHPTICNVECIVSANVW